MSLIGPSLSLGTEESGGGKCAAYGLPESVLQGDLHFAGETIPLGRRDVRLRLRHQVNFLMLDARSVLTFWLQELSRLNWIFQEVFEKHNIPKDFVFFAPVISGLDPRSSPRVGGAGWWSLETACSESEGVPMRVDKWQDERLDLELSTACFAERIKSLRDDLNTKSWLLAAAAYISAKSRIADRRQAWSAERFWDMPLPENAETLVSRWIALGMIARSPEAFGLKIKYEPPFTFDHVTGLSLKKDLTVGELAKMIGIPPRLVLDLNPKIRASEGRLPARIRKKNIVHSLITPRGKGQVLVKNLKQKGFLKQKQ